MKSANTCRSKQIHLKSLKMDKKAFSKSYGCKMLKQKLTILISILSNKIKGNNG